MAPADDGSSLDVDQILSAGNSLIKGLASSFQDLQGVLSEGSSAITQEQGGIKEASEAAIAISSLANNAAAKLQRDNKEAAAKFGTNPDASSYVLATLADEIKADNAEISLRRAGIQEKLDNTSILDPLGYIYNSLTLPQEVAAVNYKERTRDMKYETIKQLTVATTEAATTNAIVDQADATAVGAAESKKLKALSDIQVAQSQQKMTDLGIKGITLRDTINKGQFDAVVSMNSAQAQAKSLELSEERLDLEKARYGDSKILAEQRQKLNDLQLGFKQQAADIAQKKLELAEKREQLGEQGYQLQLKKYDIQEQGLNLKISASQRDATRLDMQLKAAELTEIEKKIRIGTLEEQQAGRVELGAQLAKVSSTFGLPVISADAYKQMPESNRKIISDVILGMKGDAAGYNTAAALENINGLNAPMTPGVNQIRNKLQTTIDTARTASMSIPGFNWQTAKEGERISIVQAQITDRIQKEALNIQPEGGVYSPPPLRSVLDYSPIVANTQIAKDLAHLYQANNLYKTDINDFTKSALKLIAGKKLTPEQAGEEIAATFKSIAVQNNELHQYQRLALPMMAEKDTEGNVIKGFKTSVYLGNGFTNTRSVDASDPAQVTNHLYRMLNVFGLQPGNYENAVPQEKPGAQ